jgi:hypothetical protein
MLCGLRPRVPHPFVFKVTMHPAVPRAAVEREHAADA